MAAFALGLIGDRAAVDAAARPRCGTPSRWCARGRRRRWAGSATRGRRPRWRSIVLAAAAAGGAASITVRGDDPGSAADPWLEPRLGLSRSSA